MYKAPSLPKCLDEKNSGGISVERASDIPILPILWLWCGWLAAGKLHILAGSPGTGKTMIALHTAAVLSRAGIWPDGTAAPFGRTIIWTGEDSVENTILPRLHAAGADMSNIFILRANTGEGYERRFDPLHDLEALRESILQLSDVKLIILDSIMQVASGEKNNAVRQALEPLVGLAEEFGIAILGISHTNKGSAKKNPVDSVTGTLAYTAVARVVWIVGPARSLEDGRRSSWGVLVRAKSNLGPCDGGFCYEITSQQLAPSIEAAALTWHAPMLEGAAKEILQEAVAENSSESNSKLRMAEDFLLERLTHGAWVGTELESEALSAGVSVATFRRARKNLGVMSKKMALVNGRMANILYLPESEIKQFGQPIQSSPPYSTQISPPVNVSGFSLNGQHPPADQNIAGFSDFHRFDSVPLAAVQPTQQLAAEPLSELALKFAEDAGVELETTSRSVDEAKAQDFFDPYDGKSLMDVLKSQSPNSFKDL